MTNYEIRLAAADLIERTGWAQGAAAYDRNGQVTHPSSDGACSFCITGALDRVLIDRGVDRLYVAERKLRICMELRSELPDIHTTAVEFNDTVGRTKEEVLKLLRGKL